MKTKPNWENRTIWTGDNLDVLRGMNGNCVDLIYLDPPFNSNHNYAAPIGSKAAGAEFKDTWTLKDIDEAWRDMVEESNPMLHKVITMAGEVCNKSMEAYMIYMAIRIIEMYRILKDTGSLYLHCDATASHYLKLMLDSVFGKTSFRNEIIWQRASGRAKGSQHKANKLGVDTDSIFFYGKTEDTTFNGLFKDLSAEELAKKFPLEDEGGRYNLGTPLFCQPSMGARPNLCYTYKGVTNPHPSGWRVSKDKLIQMDKEGLIIFRKGKSPQRKSYASEYKGKPTGTLWTDIPIAGGKERTGYPTQKPLKLLDRIIEMSSSIGDIVLDPFCGCATTLVAADGLNREWVGIDVSSLAAKLVYDRIFQEQGELFGKIISRQDVPTRTDLGNVKKYNHPDNKQHLYVSQDGVCPGCNIHFPYKNMTIDHKHPKILGGDDHITNLQLLCNACNSSKGTKSEAEWRASIKSKEEKRK